MDRDKVMEKLLKAHPSFFDADNADDISDDIYAVVDDTIRKLDLGLSFYFPYDSDVYIGLDRENIGEDETGKQFRERAQKEVSQLLGEDVPVDNYSESWRDG
jgi:hypothetical protein